MKCVLCGGTHFREDEDGLWCKNCGAGDGPPAPPGFDMTAHLRELEELRREDEAHLRDLGADMGYGLHRSDGAL